MTVRTFFTTTIFKAQLTDPALLTALAHTARTLAAEERAGRVWSRENRYKDYSSYASLGDLPRRDPDIAALAHWLESLP